MPANVTGTAHAARGIHGLDDVVTPVQKGETPLRRVNIGLRVSTVLLLLALLGLALRLSGVSPWLVSESMPIGLVLVVLAPVWAACGFLASTVYLMLSVMRPYSVVQHLVEMVSGVALIVMMAPVF